MLNPNLVQSEVASGSESFPVNYYRGRSKVPQPSLKGIPVSSQKLGALDPNTVFGMLREASSLAKQAPRAEGEKAKTLVPQKDYQLTSFFIRKPKENPDGDPQHWAMYFKVDRPQMEKWIKVDLIRDEYRVIYHTNLAPIANFSGTDDYYSVTGLTVPVLYQLLSTVAKTKGRLTGNKGPNKYNCQDFANAMLEELTKYSLKPGNPVNH